MVILGTTLGQHSTDVKEKALQSRGSGHFSAANVNPARQDLSSSFLPSSVELGTIPVTDAVSFFEEMGGALAVLADEAHGLIMAGRAEQLPNGEIKLRVPTA